LPASALALHLSELLHQLSNLELELVHSHLDSAALLRAFVLRSLNIPDSVLQRGDCTVSLVPAAPPTTRANRHCHRRQYYQRERATARRDAWFRIETSSHCSSVPFHCGADGPCLLQSAPSRYCLVIVASYVDVQCDPSAHDTLIVMTDAAELPSEANVVM
jgi:hypothetical protein